MLTDVGITVNLRGSHKRFLITGLFLRASGWDGTAETKLKGMSGIDAGP